MSQSTESVPSLFLLIPGFGAPHIPKKIDILRHNLSIILSQIHFTPKPDIYLKHIRICAYDSDGERALQEMLADCVQRYCAYPFLRPPPTLQIVCEPGKVGEFIYAHGSPSDSAIAACSHILILLDDVELPPTFRFEILLRYMRDFSLNIITPSLSQESIAPVVFPHMLTNPGEHFAINITPVAEFFAYFMDTAFSFPRYYSFLDAKTNPWMWGMDLILHKKMGLRVGVLNRITMRHHFRGTGVHEAMHDRKEYLERLGETETSVASQPVSHYYIFDPQYKYTSTQVLI